MSEKNAVTILSDALLAMTNRAIEAERQAAAEKQRADDWSSYYQSKAKEADDLKAKLDITRLERNKHEAVANGLRTKLGETRKDGIGNE